MKNKAEITKIKEFIEERYNLRNNVVSNRVEYKLKSKKEWIELNEAEILVELLVHHFKASSAVLIALLQSSFVKEYNPIKEYFEDLKEWDKTDYINKLCSYISVSDDDKNRFETQFKKMFVRSIASGLGIALNKQSFILVHQKQNSGKTTFLRWLNPDKLGAYYTEEIGLDKDSLIALTENFIINLDELSTLSKKDINELKSVMSKNMVKVRLPYARRTTLLKRRCSFVGSTNQSEFLSDETGNVRWVCFNIDNINWSYNKDFDIDKIWAQAYYLFNNGFDYQLSQNEIIENEVANQKFIIRTPEMELLQLYFTPVSEDSLNAEFLTATEITSKVVRTSGTTEKLYSNRMGKALSLLGFEKTGKYNKKLKYTAKGYWVKSKLPSETGDELPF